MSPTGFCRRLPTREELCDLWDFQISLTELCSRREDFIPFVDQVLESPPAKILLLGADCLLTSTFTREAKSFLSGEKRIEDGRNLFETFAKRCKHSSVAWSSDSSLGRTAGQPALVTGGVKPASSTPSDDTAHHHAPSSAPTRAIYDVQPASVDPSFVIIPTRTTATQDDVVIKQDDQRADGARVPTELWDNFFEENYRDNVGKLPDEVDACMRSDGKYTSWRAALNGFRRFTVRRYRRNLLRGYVQWRRHRLPLRESPASFVFVKEMTEDGYPVYSWTKKGQDLYARGVSKLKAKRDGPASLKMAADGLSRASGPFARDQDGYVSFKDGDEYLHAWWEWSRGSTLFYWNWPEQFQQDARDGQPHMMTGEPKTYRRPQPRPSDPTIAERIRSKLLPVRLREYIETGTVNSLLHYFWVPKGEDDIRMVYDGSGCGINDFLYAAHFGLPTVSNTARALLPGYFQCDMDVGGCF